MEFKSYRGRALDPNKPVKIFRNLNNELLSIVQGDVVVGHADKCTLVNASFHVQPAGQSKCRTEKRKNFHAYVKGMVSQELSAVTFKENRRVFYDPYKYDTFVDEKGVTIGSVRLIEVLADGRMRYN